jgi:hypothetical protein
LSKCRNSPSTKPRSPEFEPTFCRIEKLSSPDILDDEGRQTLLPVCRPVSEQTVEQQQEAKSSINVEILKAMAADPRGSQREWAAKTGINEATVWRRLAAMEKKKLEGAARAVPSQGREPRRSAAVSPGAAPCGACEYGTCSMLKS